MTPNALLFPTAASIPFWTTTFLLILCRVSATVMTMPGLGEQSLPMTVRAGIALSLSGLIFPLLVSHLPAVDFTTISPFAVCQMVGGEVFAGLFIGWMARLAAMALPVAGQIIALLTGLSSVSQPDPDLGSGSSALARFLNLLAPLVLLVTGAYTLPIKALVGSYDVIAPFSGGFHRPVDLGVFLADACHHISLVTERCFMLSLELSAPFLILSTVWQVLTGILCRLLPNLQITSLLNPIQILGGIALFSAVLFSIVTFWQNQVFDILRTLPGL